MFRMVKLRPPHGWDAVAWELGIVVLGVLIAEDLIAILLLSVPPVISVFKRLAWESRRWQESDHSPFGS